MSFYDVDQHCLRFPDIKFSLHFLKFIGYLTVGLYKYFFVILILDLPPFVPPNPCIYKLIVTFFFLQMSLSFGMLCLCQPTAFLVVYYCFLFVMSLLRGVHCIEFIRLCTLHCSTSHYSSVQVQYKMCVGELCMCSYLHVKGKHVFMAAKLKGSGGSTCVDCVAIRTSIAYSHLVSSPVVEFLQNTTLEGVNSKWKVIGHV